ncbi:MAG: FAD-dependent oxidoreductase [Nitrosomonas sp.]|nr:FAD-dependent oxidoreductase [Nitrosomonas sp.]
MQEMPIKRVFNVMMTHCFVLTFVLYLPMVLKGTIEMHEINLSGAHEITVIGAGPAGLLAAYRLKQAGIPVRVVEARSRIGGRLYSYPQEKIEFGAWSLGDGGNIEYVQSLATELGLELYTSRMPFPGYSLKDGQLVDVSSLFKELIGNDQEKTRARLASIIDSSRSLQDVLDVFFKDHSILKQFCESLTLVYHGSAAADISAKFYKESIIELCLGGVSDLYTHSVSFFPLYRVRGGNDLIVKKLAEYLKDSLELNKPLKGLCKGNKQKIKLLFADGTSQETDSVILALPISAYHTLEIEDGLIPVQQLETIKKTCPGVVSKIFIAARGCAYPKGFFISDGYSAGIGEDDKYLTMHWAKPVDLEVCRKSVSMVTRALNWPEPSEFITIQDSSRESFPPNAALIVDWPHTAYTHGSYCAFSPAQNDFLRYENIDGVLVNALFKPAGNIFFAGEAASVHASSGSVGAALESAEVAVRLIKQRWG